MVTVNSKRIRNSNSPEEHFLHFSPLLFCLISVFLFPFFILHWFTFILIPLSAWSVPSLTGKRGSVLKYDQIYWMSDCPNINSSLRCHSCCRSCFWMLIYFIPLAYNSVFFNYCFWFFLAFSQHLHCTPSPSWFISPSSVSSLWLLLVSEYK